MKIKSLTLHGFKSFADKTKVELHDGITAIVGPNGCGKSNISDALRWVLGEQRPTAIRGSRMEEAIFGGTEGRRPIHRAEVTLEISNEDGALPVPYSEVSIGRTVYRGGESEYMLNGATCRLKDILDLCRDTGLGANAYAMIEGRMVDAILSDRAEERRSLFEEAAEIGRYKDRRRIATRRLEQAEADLQRLDDVLVEIQAKVRSLAQQRGRAERHGKLKKRLLQLEVAAADAHLERTELRLVEARAELEGLRNTGPSDQVDLQTAETETETLRVEFAEMETERAELARRAEEARRAVEEQERTRLLAQERIATARERLTVLTEETRQLEARRSGLETSLEQAREIVAGAETVHATHADGEEELRLAVEALVTASREATATREVAREALEIARRDADRWNLELSTTEARARDRSDELDRRRPALDALREQEETLRAAVESASALEAGGAERLRQLRNDLSQARSETERAEESLRDSREQAAKLEGRLSTARAQASSLGSLVGSSALLPETVAQLLEERDSIPGVHGALSEFLSAPSSWASAVESQLGPYLHGVVVRDWNVVVAVQEWLESRGAEEGVLVLPLDPGPDRPSASASSPLSEHVEASGAGAVWVEALLSGISAPEAGSLARRDGPWVGSDGRRQDQWGGIFLGRPGAGDGVLSRRAELQTRRAEVTELETLRSELGETLIALEVAAREGRVETERLESAVADAESERREAEADRASATARLQRLDQERDDLSGRIEQLEAFHETETAATAGGADRTLEFAAAVEGAEAAHLDAHAKAEAARHAAEAKRAELHTEQLERARLEADLGNRREVMDRIAESLHDVEARTKAQTEESAHLSEVLAQNERITVESEEAIAAGLDERSDREIRLADLEKRIAERRQFLEQRESELKNARRQERELTERRHALELEVTQLDAAEAAVRGRLEAEWDATLEQLREQVEPPEEGDPQTWEDELEQVRRSIARIGPVNLLAQQEYEEEGTRLQFLTEQRDDLVQARDDLRSSIRRINKHAAETFLETFDQVRANFHRTFESLFEGGECDVWLDNPDDPLDSPIEISASPRGKKTQRIHLLSGGERALTALALLFAIYLAKPSPFCLLDEVDAPLDETNILRFVRMLEEFKGDTQFIVITHNRRTMEGADWIYGVTMQEPGVSSIVGVEFDANAAGDAPSNPSSTAAAKPKPEQADPTQPDQAPAVA